jgi:hypothetical protein
MEQAETVAERRATQGLVELDRWLADQVRLGLGVTLSDAASTEFIADRMEAADLPKVAHRIQTIVARPDAGVDERAAEFALLYRLAVSWRRRGELSDLVRATVRCRLGLDVPSAVAKVEDRWHVVATDHVSHAWLVGEHSGRIARLLDVAGVRTDIGPLGLGQTIAAGLEFHAESVPLCARVSGPLTIERPLPEPPGGSLTEAQTAYAGALKHDPWTERWPAVIEGAQVSYTATTGWAFADRDGRTVPLVARSPEAEASSRWLLAAACAAEAPTVFGFLDPAGFSPLTVWSDGRAARL